MQRILPTTLLTTLLLIALSACSNDCPTCDSLRNGATIQTLDVQLCGSEVPDPEADERICTEITNVSYTFVRGD